MTAFVEVRPLRDHRDDRRRDTGPEPLPRVVLADDRPERRAARWRSGQLGLWRRELELQRLGHVPDRPLAVARRSRRALHPRLDRDPRPRPLLAPRGADRDRRAHGLRPDRLQRDRRQAAGRARNQPRLRLLAGADRLDRDLPLGWFPRRGERRRRQAKTTCNLLASRSVADADQHVISHDLRDPSHPDRNLALELVRVTEAGALAAGRWVGRGEKESADGAAVDAMRLMLDTVPMDGIVVIGEGEKDEAPMLFNGEEIGDGSPPRVDIAVDPLEGTTLTARGMPSALSVIALSERGTMFDPGPCVYMEKIATGPRAADLISLDEPLEDVVRKIGERKGGGPDDVTVIMLDRPRHEEAVNALREVGAAIRFISDGDVAASLFAVMPNTGIDLLWGVGGTPEGVLSASAIKCMGGRILGRLWPRDEEERKAAEEAGYDLSQVLDTDQLVGGNDVFFAATGVTDGDLLDGVRYLDDGHATTESLVMRSRSGTVRRVQATHDRPKLREVVGARYG